MARQARKTSPSGIYHVMLRGINQQRIFEDGADEQKFLELLRKNKKRCGFALYGYSLMGNHVHLLLKEAAHPSIITINDRDVEVGPGEAIEAIFKRIEVSYVGYFNRRYKRTGHLFQDRFRSESIDTDEYLLMALRYIHLNAVKAGICEKPEDYPLSSYRDYLASAAGGFVDCEEILRIMPKEQLIDFTRQANDDRFMDMDGRPRQQKTDEEAKECLNRITGCESASAFQSLAKPEREAAMRKLRSQGVNIAQISRITGYSRVVVYRAISEVTQGTDT